MRLYCLGISSNFVVSGLYNEINDMKKHQSLSTAFDVAKK